MGLYLLSPAMYCNVSYIFCSVLHCGVSTPLPFARVHLDCLWSTVYRHCPATGPESVLFFIHHPLSSLSFCFAERCVPPSCPTNTRNGFCVVRRGNALYWFYDLDVLNALIPMILVLIRFAVCIWCFDFNFVLRGFVLLFWMCFCFCWECRFSLFPARPLSSCVCCTSC